MCVQNGLPRKRSGRAQWARAEVAPKSSPSALVRASAGLWGGCFPLSPPTTISYSRSELLALAPTGSNLPPALTRPFSPDDPDFTIPPSPSPNPPYLGLLVNVRSLPGHASQIFQLLDAHEPNFAIFTETWLNPASGPDLVSALPTNYSILHLDRVSTSPGGGVALVFNVKHRCSMLPVVHSIKMEACLIRCSLSATSTLHFLIVYRPPPADPSFADLFASFVSALSLSHPNLIILGDFNVWPDDSSDLHAARLLTHLTDLGFTQHVVGPSHEYGHTLDLIFADSSFPILTAPPIVCDWSDHYIIPWCFIPISPPSSCPVLRRSRRKWTAQKIQELPAELQPVLSKFQTVPSLADLHSVLHSVADVLAPITPTSGSAKFSAPWFTPTLRTLKANCKKAERAWRRAYLPDAKITYKLTCRRYSSAIKEAKITFFASRIRDSSNPSRELFAIAKALSAPSSVSPIVPSQALCDSLSDFFLEKIHKIRVQIASLNGCSPIANPASSPTFPSPLGSIPHSLSQFASVTPDDVAKAFLSLKSSSPLDPIPLQALKLHLSSFLPTLTSAVNHSFHSGVIPPSLKHALVVPLLKKPSLDPSIPANFRPISLLPALMKLLEVLATPQLRTFLESSNLLHPHQSGFRPLMGTETVLASVLDDLTLIRDQGGVGALILLDLSAAFDTIDHSILLTRLWESGLSGTALDWFRSFLSDRSQTLSLPPFQSSPSLVLCGVPQGSSLSPLLFNVYVRPLADLIQSHGFRFYSYADDTQILLRLDLADLGVAGRFRGCLEAVGTWMNDNWLKLNGDKTELLVVAPPHLSPTLTPDFWPLSLGPVPSPAKSVKNLGFKLLPTLSPELQISAVCSAGHLKLKILKKVLPFIPASLRAPVVGSAVHGGIDYCNSLYCAQPKKLITRLQLLQNSAVRLVTGLSKRCHVSEARRSLHWLPVQSRIDFKVLCLAHRAFYSTGPLYIREKLSHYSPIRTLRSSTALRLVTPKYRKERLGGRALSVVAPRLWNSLPLTLRSLSNHLQFRRQLKTRLFNR